MIAAKNSEFSIIREIVAAKNSDVSFGTEIVAAKNSEFEFVTELVAAKNSEFSLVQEVVDEVFITSTSTPSTPTPADTPSVVFSGDYFAPDVYVYLAVVNEGTTTDLSNYVRSVRATKTLGGKTYAEVVLIETPSDEDAYNYNIVSDQQALLNPLSGFCSNLFKHHGFNPSRYFVLKIAIGYPGKGIQSYTYPYFLVTRSETDGTELKLRLEDFAVLMEFNYLEFNPETTSPRFPDINADAKKPGSAHPAIKQVTDYCNIPNVVIGFPNFPIRLLRRVTGRPIDWVAKIAAIYQAKMNFIGNTLYFTPTPYADQATPNWVFSASHFEAGSFTVDQDLSNYKNSFRIIRTSSNGGRIGNASCTGNHCPGRTGQITFDEPVNFCWGEATVVNGIVTEFVYKDELGNPIVEGPLAGPGGLSASSAKLIASVEFTYIARIGDDPLNIQSTGQGVIRGSGNNSNSPTATAVYTPHYEVNFYGKQTPTGFDDEFRFIKRDTAGISCLGLHEDTTDYDDSIIPNAKVASDYGDALLREASRFIKFNGTTPLIIPQIEAGDCVSIDHYETAMSQVKFIVSEHSISIDGTDAQMTLRGERERL